MMKRNQTMKRPLVLEYQTLLGVPYQPCDVG